MSAKSEIALISLGSNASDGTCAPTSFILYGRERITAVFGFDAEVRFSDLYTTPAYPPGIGPDFINATVAVSTKLSAQDILHVLHDIEAGADRKRTTRWGLRTLDLDLLALGQQIVPNLETQTRWRDMPLAVQRETWPGELILPHPRLQDRAFVLVPLAQVAPDWVHPVLNLTVTQMRDALPVDDLDAIQRVDV